MPGTTAARSAPVVFTESYESLVRLDARAKHRFREHGFDLDTLVACGADGG
ncbi:MAG: hypothetical protein ACYC8T_09560 [Myxococcaceae bacterium]